VTEACAALALPTFRPANEGYTTARVRRSIALSGRRSSGRFRHRFPASCSSTTWKARRASQSSAKPMTVSPRRRSSTSPTPMWVILDVHLPEGQRSRGARTQRGSGHAGDVVRRQLVRRRHRKPKPCDSGRGRVRGQGDAVPTRSVTRSSERRTIPPSFVAAGGLSSRGRARGLVYP